VRPDRLCQSKITTPSGIEPATFQFVAQCLSRVESVTGVSVQPICPIFNGQAVTIEDETNPASYEIGTERSLLCVERTGCAVLH
jgi:hypothetical protein